MSTASSLLLALLLTQSNQLRVLLRSLARLFNALHLDGTEVTLALQGQGCDQALDLGGLERRLLALLLRLDLAADDKLAHIVLLRQVEQLADLVGTLGPQAAGNRSVGQPGQRLLSALADHQREHGKIRANDAAADGLALALTSTALAEALLALAEQQAHTVVQEDTLHHRETLLVVATGNLEHVALELVSESISNNLLGNTLVVENAELALVRHLNQLLAASGGIGNVKLQRLARCSEPGKGWMEEAQRGWNLYFTFMFAVENTPAKWI